MSVCLAEIKDRLHATTPGKWTVEYRQSLCDKPDATILTECGEYICQLTYEDQSATYLHEVVADAEFIARAKEDIQDLLNLLKNLGIE